MVKAFPGSNEYKAEDMPAIDYLILTHDHYDHLDYKTL
jgi:L-ascorbate metabolism protein UlaG (beta-lactamase superfamily)